MGFSIKKKRWKPLISQAVLWELLVKQETSSNLLFTQRSKPKILRSDFSNPFTSTYTGAYNGKRDFLLQSITLLICKN
jgi:hypothetical protein